MTRYISTRNSENLLSSAAAILCGLAEDGGLYVPQHLPAPFSLEHLQHASYQQLAEMILNAFFDDYSPDQLHQCVSAAYDAKFDTPEIVPLQPLTGGYLLELWHGPTSAFKDLALTILPHLMSTALQIQHSSDTIAILTATSGDTGKAALSGFADVPQTAVTVFYPELGVSEVQKRQMQTSAGRNVSVIAVRGNFDDCQRMVKEACSDPTIRQAARHVMISSANSINIGRLVPQIVYYFKAYADLIKLRAIRPGDPISFCVPTGNFGDILAGYLAKQCGLPIHRLICASNTNHVLADFLQTGIYSINRPFHTTMSPSMDILISSNLERLLYLASDRSSELICRCMAELKEKGEYQIPADLLARIQATFVGGWTSEQECRDTIHDLYQQEHVLIDPHTAVALHAMHAYQKESGDHFPCVVLSTASPYKFSTDVLASISGRQVDDGFAAMTQLQQLTGLPIPANLRRLPDLPIRFHKTISIEEGPDVIRRRIAELSHD